MKIITTTIILFVMMFSSYGNDLLENQEESLNEKLNEISDVELSTNEYGLTFKRFKCDFIAGNCFAYFDFDWIVLKDNREITTHSSCHIDNVSDTRDLYIENAWSIEIVDTVKNRIKDCIKSQEIQSRIEMYRLIISEKLFDIDDVEFKWTTGEVGSFQFWNVKESFDKLDEISDSYITGVGAKRSYMKGFDSRLQEKLKTIIHGNKFKVVTLTLTNLSGQQNKITILRWMPTEFLMLKDNPKFETLGFEIVIFQFNFFKSRPNSV